jgi:hypothetical protein
MGFAFRIMIWVLAFNLAVGITSYALCADNTGNSCFSGIKDPTTTGLNQTKDLFTTFNTTSGVPVEESSFWYRFLDVISLGFYQKIKLFLDSTILAIPNMLFNAGLLPGKEVGDKTLMNLVGGVIFLIYVIGMFEMFTGKDLTVR